MRFVVLFALLTGAVFGATLTDPDPSQIDNIIAKFAAKEAAFAKARSNYTYRQTAKVMTLDDGGGTTGKWEEVTDIVFSTAGARIEKASDTGNDQIGILWLEYGRSRPPQGPGGAVPRGTEGALRSIDAEPMTSS